MRVGCYTSFLTNVMVQDSIFLPMFRCLQNIFLHWLFDDLEIYFFTNISMNWKYICLLMFRCLENIFLADVLVTWKDISSSKFSSKIFFLRRHFNAIILFSRQNTPLLVAPKYLSSSKYTLLTTSKYLPSLTHTVLMIKKLFDTSSIFPKYELTNLWLSWTCLRGFLEKINPCNQTSQQYEY
jgi:hypothetical protein